METKLIVNICSYLHSGECHWHNHNHGECKYKDCQESCPHFLGTYEYQQQLWIKGIKDHAEKIFPYETEETCPNALSRTMKNQCIDCLRAGYLKGYMEGHNAAIPYA